MTKTAKTVTNILKLSPTHFVANIDVIVKVSCVGDNIETLVIQKLSTRGEFHISGYIDVGD